jgi:ubiquinone/menaquinone biosynthesis C-methylase UbiE
MKENMTDYLEHRLPLDNPDVASVVDELYLWSSRFGTLMLDNLELAAGITALDVGCGTGFPLFELAHMHGHTSRFYGVDIWAEALERAVFKLRVYGLPNVLLVRADGARLPFPEARFDLIVSNLGINNFTDPQAALEECFRVARPGGRIALTTNPHGHMREFYTAFRSVVAKFGRPDYMERLEANENHRLTEEVLTDLLRSAGFSITRTIEDSLQLRYLDGSAMLRHSLIRLGFLDAWRAVVDPNDEQAVFSALEKELNHLAHRKGELRLMVPMLYLEGRRPET